MQSIAQTGFLHQHGGAYPGGLTADFHHTLYRIGKKLGLILYMEKSMVSHMGGYMVPTIQFDQIIYDLESHCQGRKAVKALRRRIIRESALLEENPQRILFKEMKQSTLSVQLGKLVIHQIYKGLPGSTLQKKMILQYFPGHSQGKMRGE